MFDYLPLRPALLTLSLVGYLFGVPTLARAVPRPERVALQETFDLRYFKGSDRQTLDVFAPRGAKGRPVVVFVHGGSWVLGDKNLFGYHRALGQYLARQGVVAVLINYRLSPRVRHPEHVKDVARAFAWTRRHIAAYGGNPDQIVLFGHSAGGHLVSLLATDETYLKAPELALTDADRAALRGVVTVGGVYRVPGPNDCAQVVGRLLGALPDLGDGQTSSALRSIPTYIQATPWLNPFRLVFGDDPAVAVQASPLTHVHKGLPPFLVLYAEDELPLLGDMAQEFGKALLSAGVDAHLQRIDGANHLSLLRKLSHEGEPVAETLMQFIDHCTGGTRITTS